MKSPDAGLVSERKAERHRQILEAAVRAFSMHGYHGCTMAKVAKEAGVADGTLYLYVKGKEDLLVSAFIHVLDGMMERLDAALADLSDPADQLETVIRLHFEVMASDPDLAGFLQFHMRQPDPAIRAGMREPLVGYARRIEGIVERGQGSGVFRRGLSPRTARRLVFGGIDETVNAWYFRRDQEELMPKVKSLVDGLLFGILSGDGSTRSGLAAEGDLI